MTAMAHASLRGYAAARWPLLNHKGRQRELARLLTTWTNRRVRAVYNAETGVRLRADEQADVSRLTTEEANRVAASQQEYRALEARIAALEAAFARGDEEHGRPWVDGYRAYASGQGRGPERGGR